MRRLAILLALALAACTATPVLANTYAATCASLDAELARAVPGDTVALKGDCGEVVIDRDFPARVTVSAHGSSVRGLRLKGSNLTWLGGVLVAPAGMDGFAAGGYALQIVGALNVRVADALITDAKKGVVVDLSRNVILERLKAWRLREDGVIASRTVGLTVDDSRFSEFNPRPTSCAFPGGVIEGLPQRDCIARAGTWTDGNHADAIQLRNAVETGRFRRNYIRGPVGGISQMDTAGDLPLVRITIADNDIETDAYHRITLTECVGCAITGNRAARAPGSTKKAVIIPGVAKRCNNRVDDQPFDGPCS